MTGSDIPIVDEEEWLGRLSRYVLILPYYYIKHFSEVVSKNTKKGEVRYLFTLLPTPKIIEAKGEI